MLKNTFLYYLAILIPFAGLILALNYHILTFGLFTALFLTYIFIYRKITDISRLVDKNIISKEEGKKLYAPWKTINYKYFIQLYGFSFT